MNELTHSPKSDASSYLFRLPPDLKDELTHEAEARKCSLNAYLLGLLAARHRERDAVNLAIDESLRSRAMALAREFAEKKIDGWVGIVLLPTQILLVFEGESLLIPKRYVRKVNVELKAIRPEFQIRIERFLHKPRRFSGDLEDHPLWLEASVSSEVCSDPSGRITAHLCELRRKIANGRYRRVEVGLGVGWKQS